MTSAFFACLRLRDSAPDAVNPLLRAESDDAHARLLPLHVGLWLVARAAGAHAVGCIACNDGEVTPAEVGSNGDYFV